MYNNIVNRQISAKCNNIGAERTIIKGVNCFIDMWDVTDKYIQDNKKVYIIRDRDKIDENDEKIFNSYDLIFIINTQNIKYLHNLNYLQKIDGNQYNITDFNICFVTPYDINYSSRWSKKII